MRGPPILTRTGTLLPMTSLFRAGGAGPCVCNGEAAALCETFVEERDKTVRVLLVGTGIGSPGDFDRAGATISAKLLVSGATQLSVEFPGGANGECVARVAFGLELRSWRMDAYRTRLSDKQIGREHV